MTLSILGYFLKEVPLAKNRIQIRLPLVIREPDVLATSLYRLLDGYLG